MKLEANKTYVFKDGTAKTSYFYHSPSNKIYFQCFYSDGFTLETVLENNEGWINKDCIIGIGETQYFQLKETKMLKPDDKVTVEMTALDAVRLTVLIGKSRTILPQSNLLPTLRKVGQSISKQKCRIEIPFHELVDFTPDSDFYKACLAQFQDPKQDRIDALKKTIADASAQIAAIRAESK
jgi:hypothetical protein